MDNWYEADERGTVAEVVEEFFEFRVLGFVEQFAHKGEVYSPGPGCAKDRCDATLALSDAGIGGAS